MGHRLRGLIFLGVSAALASSGAGLRASEVVNEVTGLHPVVVDRVIAPTTTREIVRAIKNTHGPISIGGAKHSQGGQIAEENSLHLDMRSFNKVVAFNAAKGIITVQSGITWRDIQEVIDPANLAVSVMQSYASFTVGGSLSVNCHGRYVGMGPLIFSIKSIKLVLADGRVVEASPDVHTELFDAAIGGYGGIGVIAEATLQLTGNAKVARDSVVMPIGRYREFFFSHIRDSRDAVFHNADIYPPAYDSVRAVTWSRTDQPVTVPGRLVPRNGKYWFARQQISFLAAAPFGLGKFFRQYVIEPLKYRSHPVEWRNYEASLDVNELEPASRKKNTYVLQEYFVPVDRFDEFTQKCGTFCNVTM